MLPCCRRATMSKTDVDVLVAGAGPAGLAIALALATTDPEMMQRTAVVDPSGAWLARWHDRMARQGIEHLRSPSTHHPHPDPWSFIQHCAREGLPHVVRDGKELPSTAGFAHFTDSVIAEHALPDVMPSAVADFDVEPNGVKVNLTCGNTVSCRRLVIATGIGKPRIGENIPNHPRVRHAEAVDLRTPPPPGTRVVVVGGGLTAAHLVIGAAAAGLSVTLALRSKFRVRHFDVVPGWMGPKYLTGFTAEPNRSQRRMAVEEARGGGHLPPWARRALADLERSGVIEVLRKSPLVGVAAGTNGVRVLLGTAERWVDEVWLATGFDQSVEAHPILSQMAQRHPIPIHDGIPDLDEDLGWAGMPVHVVGAPAALVLGPTAGNLHGQRRGAFRIAKASVPNFEPDPDVARSLIIDRF